MKKCSLFILIALTSTGYAQKKTLATNYQDHFVVNFESMAPIAEKIICVRTQVSERKAL